MLKGEGNIMKKKLADDVKYIRIMLVWESNCDLDLSAFLLNDRGKVGGDLDLIFYNNAVSQDGAFIYGGDNRGCSGKDMDETIMIQLDLIQPEIRRVAFCVTISDDKAGSLSGLNHSKFTASIVSDPYDKDGEEICTVDLSDGKYSGSGMVVFELIRSGSSWEYDTVSHSVNGGLTELCSIFGLETEQ